MTFLILLLVDYNLLEKVKTLEYSPTIKNCYPRLLMYSKRNLLLNIREQREWKMPDFQLLHAALNPRTPWQPNTSLHANSAGGMPRKPPSKPPKPSNTVSQDTDLLDLGAFNANPVSVAPTDVFNAPSHPFAEVTSPLAAVDVSSTKNSDPFSEFLATNQLSSENTALPSDDPFSDVLNALQSSSKIEQSSATSDPFAGL